MQILQILNPLRSLTARAIRTDMIVVTVALLGRGLAAQSMLSHRYDYFSGSAPYAIVAGDFNGDGVMDLAVANDGSRDISMMLGKGD